MMGLLQYQFIQHALLTAVLASIVCGVVGVIIVEKKLVMMSGGIAHTSYGGVGLGYMLGFEPILGALFVSTCAALGIGYVKRKGFSVSDVVIGMFWSLGMALGVLFIALTPGYPPDLSSYLFGSILSVTRADLIMMAILTASVVLIVTALFDYWQSYLFDEEFAALMGVRTAFLEYLLFVLIAMAIVVLLRAAGIILVMALFTAPTAIAAMLARSLQGRMVWAVFLGGIFCLTGLCISYIFNIASGAAIVMTAAAAYVLAFGLKNRTNPGEGKGVG
ncbi:MAG: metal ABC transporter permease [Clostridia bacterium]|jgi:zinc transport system permease protein|nr:metal ABC transporter permease [Clostridia bacterium]